MANIAISQLPPATSLSGAELVPVDQPDGLGGYQTLSALAGEIANLPYEAPYVVAQRSSAVPQARLLEGADGDISVFDQGAGNGVVVDLVDTAVTPGTYGDTTYVVQITVDRKGRITAIENVAVALLITQYLQSLPTTLPSQPNEPWNNGGVISIS